MRVLFAPDWRAGTPYQRLLAKALSQHGDQVSFLSEYYRGLPLFRGTRIKVPDLVHIHWPDAHFSQRGDGWDRVRVARYPLDCWLTAHYRPIVLTLIIFSHTTEGTNAGFFRNVRYAGRRSQAVFVHSNGARRLIRERFALSDDRIQPSLPVITRSYWGSHRHARRLGPDFNYHFMKKYASCLGTLVPIRGIRF
jgi:hypothetical protein